MALYYKIIHRACQREDVFAGNVMSASKGLLAVEGDFLPVGAHRWIRLYPRKLIVRLILNHSSGICGQSGCGAVI